MTEMQHVPEREVSGWAAGGLLFAACMLTMVGAFQAITGLVAIVDDEFYVVTRNYTFELDTTTWGWIHLVIGLAVLATGAGLFMGSGWAGKVAILLAVLSAAACFFFIPFYPFWAIVIIALNVWVIWSLTRTDAVGM
jgi:hypothetical protein